MKHLISDYAMMLILMVVLSILVIGFRECRRIEDGQNNVIEESTDG